ncbi:GNAT family N-acetyltransferase [Siminovitchia sp. FSL H7-0308]|uniref:GNAT family N-acetyltransferase n=1 Tax=unclassified Siminovitchia TaxID=2837530 RepID=UPI0030D45BC0
MKENLANILEQIGARPMELRDIYKVNEMAAIGFGDPSIPFKPEHLASQIETFPEGQVVIEHEDGTIIGSCSSVIVNFEDYGVNHSFDDISDKGYIRNHNPQGKNLYGTEVVVHPEYRGLKVGMRLYEARRQIVKAFQLESILFGGRIPNYHKHAQELTPEQYAQKVINGELHDPVMTFQLRNGFKFISIMPNYLPQDAESLKYAALMEWKNPDYKQV